MQVALGVLITFMNNEGVKGNMPDRQNHRFYVCTHYNFGWESENELALDESGAHCLFEDNKRQIGLENKILGGKREDTFIHRSKILYIF